MINYLICSTQRSGSSYLCYLLRETGVLGRPSELFGKKGACERLAKKYKLKEDEVEVAKYIKEKWKSSSTDVFGLKMHYHQYMAFLENKKLKEVFGDFKYIYIDRKDLIAQAVSLYKARSTGAWSSNHESTGHVEYSYRGINESLYFLCQEKALWESFFSSIDVQPLRITYEELEEEPSEQVERISNYLGVKIRENVFSFSDVGISKQRDDISESYKENFIRESRLKIFKD